MNTSNVRPRSFGRRAWDAAGSWLILVIVIFVTWNASTEWNDTKHRQELAIIVNKGFIEREDLRLRNRALNDRNYQLAFTIGQMGKELPQALEKANETLDKVDQTLDQVKNSLSSDVPPIPEK